MLCSSKAGVFSVAADGLSETFLRFGTGGGPWFLPEDEGIPVNLYKICWGGQMVSGMLPLFLKTNFLLSSLHLCSSARLGTFSFLNK